MLLLPYLAWVCFAAALNYQFLQLNPDADGGYPEGAVERVRVHIRVAKFLRDRFGAGDALVARLVGEPRRADEIADGVKALHPRLQPFVDDHMAAVDFDAEGLEPQIFRVPRNPDGEDDAVGLHRFGFAVFRFDGRRHGVFPLLQFFNAGGGEDFHLLFLELFFGEGGNFRIFGRQDAVDHLDHRDVCAEGVVEARELDADGAGADDQQVLRHHVASSPPSRSR